jgi:hypothetical protein
MALDDLRAALGDLAAQVDGMHEVALPAVRDRGRHRRRRRNGIITGATTTALVVIVAAGIALVGHHQTPHDIATGPVPPPPPHWASPPTTAACTTADAEDYRRAPMPVPTRVTTTRVYDHNRERLDPPPAGARPKIPASKAWAETRNSALYRVATYELVLTSYSIINPTGALRAFAHPRLAWVLIGHHVPHDTSPRRGPSPSVARPTCSFVTELHIVDANTGRGLLESTF